MPHQHISLSLGPDVRAHSVMAQLEHEALCMSFAEAKFSFKESRPIAPRAKQSPLAAAITPATAPAAAATAAAAVPGEEAELAA